MDIRHVQRGKAIRRRGGEGIGLTRFAVGVAGVIIGGIGFQPRDGHLGGLVPLIRGDRDALAADRARHIRGRGDVHAHLRRLRRDVPREVFLRAVRAGLHDDPPARVRVGGKIRVPLRPRHGKGRRGQQEYENPCKEYADCLFHCRSPFVFKFKPARASAFQLSTFIFRGGTAVLPRQYVISSLNTLMA